MKKMLTKKQRTRVRRVFNNWRGVRNHLKKDGIEEIFADEIAGLEMVINSLRRNARRRGYDAEEDLSDVCKESHYT